MTPAPARNRTVAGDCRLCGYSCLGHPQWMAFAGTTCSNPGVSCFSRCRPALTVPDTLECAVQRGTWYHPKGGYHEAPQVPRFVGCLKRIPGRVAAVVGYGRTRAAPGRL